MALRREVDVVGGGKDSKSALTDREKCLYIPADSARGNAAAGGPRRRVHASVYGHAQSVRL